MIELLRRVRDEDPDRIAVVTHDDTYTYAQLTRAAENVAAAFVRDGVRRAALVEVQAFDVIAALAGASLAGTQLCLYPPENDQVAGLQERFDHELVLGNPPLVTGARPLPLDGPGGDASAALPDARPHLVLTTGTTGAPRGVLHDWSRLLRGVDHVRPGDGQRWLLAFGLHQFAGLQVVLHVMASGATLVAPAPRRPKEGLRAIHELGVTHASATPTFWRFLLAEMRADRRDDFTLEQITLGGEAAPKGLLDDLRAAFPQANVSHVYAASEFGSTGSVGDGLPGLPASVLERGDAAPTDMKLVDGEIWVRSRTGMLGYHGEDPIDADAWRPSGDLAEVVDGRLLFRGRISEVINVGGVKVHPLVVEDKVTAVPGVAVARVFGRPNALAGAIVAVEVVLADGHDADDVDGAIRDACAELPSAARPRSIKFVDAIETRGDKVIRRSP